MAWIDYDSLSRTGKILVWAVVVVLAVVVASILWLLGFRSSDASAVG